MNRNGTASPRLFLVRHGQDLDNSHGLINGQRDTPLTDTGRAQAAAAAEALRPAGIAAVYTSPLERARRTASIIAETLGIGDLRIDPDLIERDYGPLTGRSPDDIASLAVRSLVSHGFRYVIEAPGVEEYPSLYARAGEVLGRLRSRDGPEPVLIVAHNEIIKMIRAHWEGRPWEDELRRPQVGNGEWIALA